MKVSFLITYYNQENYVFDSLNSISKIRKPNEYEVIVGNDGSSDHTLQEIEKWRDAFGDRLKVFSANRNDGVVDGVVRAGNLRRELLKRSTGDAFCVLDGDDYYCDTNFIYDAINVFEKNSDVSVVMFKHRMYYPDHVDEINTGMTQGTLQPSQYIKRYYCGSGACVYKMIRNDVFSKRIEKAVYYDDNDIPILNLAFGSLFFIDRPIINYRQHDDSTWNSMGRAERGVLNVLGADNEVLLAPEYKNEVYFRYRRDILYTYFRRFNAEKYIEMNALKKYRMIAKSLQSLSRVLLDYDNTSEKEREEVELILKHIKDSDPDEYERVRGNVIKEGGLE